MSVITLAGGLSYVYWQHYNDARAMFSANTQKTAKTTNDLDSTNMNIIDGYLVLNDWSVRFKLPTDTNDNQIIFKKVTNDSWGDYYGFSTKRASDLGGYCVNLVNFYRQTKTVDYSVSVPTLAGNINGYYYYIAVSEHKCLENGTNIQSPDTKMIENMLMKVEKNNI